MTLQTQAPLDSNTIEKVLLGGDLETLTPAQRLSYYRNVCESLGLNPMTRPFQYIKLNNKLVLYLARDGADQLRRKHNISISNVSTSTQDGIYIVIAHATNPEGRTDESIGAVPIEGLKGEARANATMKAETKAKRRVTLSICGLGWLDETEVDTIAGVTHVDVDDETGEILSSPRQQAQKPPQPAAGGRNGHLPTSEAQVRRLIAIMKANDVPEEAVRAWMAHMTPDKTSRRQLTRIEYDDVVAWVERGGHVEEFQERPDDASEQEPLFEEEEA